MADLKEPGSSSYAFKHYAILPSKYLQSAFKYLTYFGLIKVAEALPSLTFSPLGGMSVCYIMRNTCLLMITLSLRSRNMVTFAIIETEIFSNQFSSTVGTVLGQRDMVFRTVMSLFQ